MQKLAAGTKMFRYYQLLLYLWQIPESINTIQLMIINSKELPFS